MRTSLLTVLIMMSFNVHVKGELSPVFTMPFAECFKPETYVSGEDCYTKFNKPEYLITGWQFLEVPVDYKSASAGKTKISYKLSPGFSFDRKTIIYFNGGPGGTSYSANFDALNDINIIYLNQRGAAFSRPETKELFLNQDYYSSENTARDALEIVKLLRLTQVTAYGMSYGTVPATIFGSLFPEYTRNVILEGVVFDGQSRLWYGSHRIKLLQKYFDKLDKPLKEAILKYSRHPQVFPGWFSGLGQKVMYDANFEKSISAKLNEIFNIDSILPDIEKEKNIIEKLKSYSFRNLNESTDAIWFSSILYSFIACKELQVQDKFSSFYAVFNDKNKMVPYEKNFSESNLCQKLNITKSEMYSAINYPISVPVYYFQGTTDGATTADYAIWHYKLAAQGRAQLVLAKLAGHPVIIQHLSKPLDLKEIEKTNPLIVAEAEKSLALQVAIVNVFRAAVNNEVLDISKVNELIGDKKAAWVKTKKGI